MYEWKRIKVLSWKVLTDIEGDDVSLFGFKTKQNNFLPIKIIPEWKKEQDFKQWFLQWKIKN